MSNPVINFIVMNYGVGKIEITKVPVAELKKHSVKLEKDIRINYGIKLDPEFSKRYRFVIAVSIRVFSPELELFTATVDTVYKLDMAEPIKDLSTFPLSALSVMEHTTAAHLRVVLSDRLLEVFKVPFSFDLQIPLHPDQQAAMELIKSLNQNPE